MADEVEGFGTKLEYGDEATYAASTTWTEIAEIVDLTPPSDAASDIDTTHMQTTGHVRTFQAGLVDPGEVTLKCHFDKTAFGTLRGMLRTAKGWRLTYSDTSNYKFDGYVKGFGSVTPLDGIVEVDVTIKVSGQGSYTAAT